MFACVCCYHFAYCILTLYLLRVACVVSFGFVLLCRVCFAFVLFLFEGGIFLLIVGASYLFAGHYYSSCVVLSSLVVVVCYVDVLLLLL